MVKILWFSRHYMTAEEEVALATAIGKDFFIKQVFAVVHSGKLIAEYGSDCDILAVDSSLTADILAGLILEANKSSKLVIRPIESLLTTDQKSHCTGWELVKGVTFDTEEL